MCIRDSFHAGEHLAGAHGHVVDRLCNALPVEGVLISRHPVSYTHLDVYKRQALGDGKNPANDVGAHHQTVQLPCPPEWEMYPLNI